MGTKTVYWKEGGYLLVKTTMDEDMLKLVSLTLGKRIQPPSDPNVQVDASRMAGITFEFKDAILDRNNEAVRCSIPFCFLQASIHRMLQHSSMSSCIPLTYVDCVARLSQGIYESLDLPCTHEARMHSSSFACLVLLSTCTVFAVVQ